MLFDRNVPQRLRRFLRLHEVSTTGEMGWKDLENGELLRATEPAGFAVMVTCDKNISYQQNLRDMNLALIVLSTNNWNMLKQNFLPVVRAQDSATPRSVQAVYF